MAPSMSLRASRKAARRHGNVGRKDTDSAPAEVFFGVAAADRCRALPDLAGLTELARGLLLRVLRRGKAFEEPLDMPQGGLEAARCVVDPRLAVMADRDD